MKRMLCTTLVCMLLILCACSGTINTKDARWPVTIGEYTFTRVPKRVVTLSPAMTDTIYTLGYGGRVVGVSDYCELPAAARDAVQCGTVLLPNTDAILQLGPDMLFTSAPLPISITKSLEEAGVQVVVVTYADTLEGLMQNYRLICTAFEGESIGRLRAEQLVYFAENTRDYLRKAVISATESETRGAIYLRKLPAFLATGDTLEGRLLDDIGFENIGSDATGWYYPLETLKGLMPDYIFCDYSISLEVLKSSDYYKQAPAVSDEKVYSFDARVFERQSPAMFLSLEELLRSAFPNAFEMPKPSIIMPMPEPEPEPEKSWWQKLYSK